MRSTSAVADSSWWAASPTGCPTEVVAASTGDSASRWRERSSRSTPRSPGVRAPSRRHDSDGGPRDRPRTDGPEPVRGSAVALGHDVSSPSATAGRSDQESRAIPVSGAELAEEVPGPWWRPAGAAGRRPELRRGALDRVGPARQASAHRMRRGCGPRCAEDRRVLGAAFNRPRTELEAAAAGTTGPPGCPGTSGGPGVRAARPHRVPGPGEHRSSPPGHPDLGTTRGRVRRHGFTVATGPRSRPTGSTSEGAQPAPCRTGPLVGDTLPHLDTTDLDGVGTNSSCCGPTPRQCRSRTMLRAVREEWPSDHVVCPGRAYRQDTADATHPVFRQIEMLVIDRHHHG